jgi:hypothetical protein
MVIYDVKSVCVFERQGMEVIVEPGKTMKEERKGEKKRKRKGEGRRERAWNETG